MVSVGAAPADATAPLPPPLDPHESGTDVGTDASLDSDALQRVDVGAAALTEVLDQDSPPARAVADDEDEYEGV